MITKNIKKYYNYRLIQNYMQSSSFNCQKTTTIIIINNIDKFLEVLSIMLSSVNTCSKHQSIHKKRKNKAVLSVMNFVNKPTVEQWMNGIQPTATVAKYEAAYYY